MSDFNFAKPTQHVMSNGGNSEMSGFTPPYETNWDIYGFVFNMSRQ